MAAFEYVGRPPDSDSVVVTKAYADADNAVTSVTNGFIDNQVATQGGDLVTQNWITEQVANYATQSMVTAANSAYVLKTALAAAHGIAQSGAGGVIPSVQLPAVSTNRLALSYNIATSGTNFLAGDSFTVVTTNLNEYTIASLPIPDPGFPWYPLAEAFISGQAAGTPSGSRFVGNGNLGFLTVMPPSGVSNTIYSAGVCTADTVTGWYECLPYGATQGANFPMTPANQPPILGPLTLNLGACCYSGTGFTFNGPGLVYHVTVIPAMGTGVIPGSS